MLVQSEAAAKRLDLIKGHLRNNGYRDVNRNLPEEMTSKNVMCPNDGIDTPASVYVMKVLTFTHGHEVTVLKQDLTQQANIERNKGKRKEEDSLKKETDQIRSALRAKTKVRHTIKMLQADRLLTLTKRETENFMSQQQWADAWKKFCVMTKKAGYDFAYVAVLEKHKKGNYHLHVALSGRLPVNLIRQIWYSCVGHKMGNVDISYKHALTKSERINGAAKYISKYITKQLGNSEFNKKKYWSTKSLKPEQLRIVVNQTDVLEMYSYICELLGISQYSNFSSLYVFPEQKGLWFTIDEDMPCLIVT